MQRVGVAATVVSALIFVSLLSSAYLMTEALRDRVLFLLYADSESMLNIHAKLKTASSAYILLYEEQRYISQNILKCDSGPSQLPIFSLNYKKDNETLYEYIKQSSMQNVNTESYFGSFSGAKEDETNFEVNYAYSSLGYGNTVSIRREGYYTLHLGFRLERASTLCMNSSLLFERTISSIGDLCNETAIYTTANMLKSKIRLDALLSGFDSSLSYSFTKAGKCGYILYTIIITQNNIKGPAGEFSASVSHSGLVVL
jgi:hypothetical protein